MSATTASHRPLAAPPRPPGRSRRGLAAVLGVGLLMLLLAGGLWVVGFSSVLQTRAVSVTGVDVLTTAEVRQAAAVPLGRPLVRQDLDRVARAVAELRPVRSVRVERQWPHTVVIRVTERTPAIAVRQPDGLLLLDRTGVGYQTVAELPDGVLRARVDPTYVRLVVDVAQVAAELPARFRSDVEVIEARSPAAIVVALDSGVRVRWGSKSDSELKAEIATALLKRDPQEIDVSAPHNPAIR